MASNQKRQKMSENTPSCSIIKEETFLGAEFDGSTSNFDEIVTANCYVDKSLLIKTIFDNAESGILITAPRRFGKSTNMDMVNQFFEIQVDKNGVVIDREKSPNRQIFENNNLLIFQDKDFFDQHFATYPVIHVDFKDTGGKSIVKVLQEFRLLLCKAFKAHEYLLKSDKLSPSEVTEFNRYQSYFTHKKLSEPEIQCGLKFLSKCLYKHFDNKKVFLLIDEYDAPINDTTLFDDKVKIDDINDLLTNIFTETLKENEFVGRAFLTGISYFASVGLSKVNNIKKITFLGDHLFVKYYGLTESEVDALFSKFKIDDKTRDDVKSYYNGYSSRGNIKLFSLWSVLSYLVRKDLIPHWQQSGLICGLRGALRIPLIQFAIEKLLQDDYPRNVQIFEKITLDDMVELQEIVLRRRDKKKCNPDLFLNFLLQQGYLSYKCTENQENIVLTFTNNQIRAEFKRKLTDYFGESKNRALEQCAAVFDQISVSDTSSFQKFAEYFVDVVDRTSDAEIKENERIFHYLLFSVICKSQFQLCDVEFLGSRDRPDLIAVKGKNGFMIEIKFRQDSKKVLQQIIEKKYYTKFDSEEFKHLEHKLYLGVNVSEDVDVSLAVLVNTLDINKAEYFSR